MLGQIVGLKRLKAKLQKLPAAAHTEIRDEMEKQAQAIVNFAKSLVPVDDGPLKNSIGWTWGDVPKGAMVLLRGRPTLKQGLTLHVYAGNSEAFYARWIEFGTQARINGGQFAGTAHPGTSAQPFFFPAYRALRKPAKAAVRRAVNRSAKKIAST